MSGDPYDLYTKEKVQICIPNPLFSFPSPSPCSINISSRSNINQHLKIDSN